jgi:thioredoxin 1
MPNKSHRVAPKPTHVADGDVLGLIASTAGAVVVDAGTNHCVPCEKLEPVLRKLAAEFADRLVVLEVDGTAEAFQSAYRVHSFPQLLFFRDGQYVRRDMGFKGAQEVRQSVLNFLGLDDDPEPSAAETAFRAAYVAAQAAMDEIMAPPSQALEPHLDHMDRAVQELEASIAAEAASGLITPEEARERQEGKYEQAYAPFRDKMEALRNAQAKAVARYREIMATAVEEFIQSHAGSRRQGA